MAAREAIGKCPICGGQLEITRLSCTSCNTNIEGHFTVCKFCQLPPELKVFAEVFIKNRGNIKDVEKELGISYPAVRSRLDQTIVALGYSVDQEPSSGKAADAAKKKEVLESLRRGEISAEEAIKKLKLR
ncbi:MAG TPA: DUF2089 domain-containing protein [Bacillota bacterium]|mgnify:FL=1|nr:DUF2089 domain-containing protein [Bacillota bacterium]HOH10233.1 DUF2089 domain-containing protein [Bacillota bacterium]HOY88619.1 DUF2089 domain-containing protein [Bacillota bacterium]HPI01195.1 DUF2089 domain-containing protein [Bacillota bacterium]HPM63552.1 DUF2089 domain-containing protein [Bacillota bacterium]